MSSQSGFSPHPLCVFEFILHTHLLFTICDVYCSWLVTKRKLQNAAAAASVREPT